MAHPAINGDLITPTPGSVCAGVVQGISTVFCGTNPIVTAGPETFIVEGDATVGVLTTVNLNSNVFIGELPIGISSKDGGILSPGDTTSPHTIVALDGVHAGVSTTTNEKQLTINIGPPLP